MKKNDWILALIILAAAGIFMGWNMILAKTKGEYVRIYQEGKLLGEYPLSRDDTVAVGRTNVVEILGGKVRMKKADCKDQLCVRQHVISKNRESIICLPNQVVVEISSGEESDYDAIVK